LGFAEPTILAEQPNLGKTVIEKLEHHAATSGVAFVLLTPDDAGHRSAENREVQRRARQNVIFEFGYFLGLMKRSNGRVVVLHKGPLEMPSDLAGVAYIDVSRGIEAAGELIRREVEAWR
jgi:predicted nucleotide-binding protein